jgi:hypothetical protein
MILEYYMKDGGSIEWRVPIDVLRAVQNLYG